MDLTLHIRLLKNGIDVKLDKVHTLLKGIPDQLNVQTACMLLEEIDMDMDVLDYLEGYQTK